MPSTSTPYTQMRYTTKPTFTGVNWAEMMIEAGMLTHEDIPIFLFPPLEEIRKDLTEAGRSAEEIENTIAGLSELPEYANSHRNQTRRR